MESWFIFNQANICKVFSFNHFRTSFLLNDSFLLIAKFLIFAKTFAVVLIIFFIFISFAIFVLLILAHPFDFFFHPFDSFFRHLQSLSILRIGYRIIITGLSCIDCVYR